MHGQLCKRIVFFLCAIFSEFTRTFWKMWELKCVRGKNLPWVWLLVYCVVHFPFAELDQVGHQVVPKGHLVGTVVRLDRRLNIWKIEHLFMYWSWTSKGSFGIRTSWCVLNKELCTSDWYFLWGCVRSNLSKPCSIQKLLLCGVGIITINQKMSRNSQVRNLFL